MKFSVLFLIAFSAICYAADTAQLNDQQREGIHLIGKTCTIQSGTTAEEVRKLRTGDFTNTDPKTKCFVNCFLEKLGFLKDGVPQEDVVSGILGPIFGEENVNETGRKCNGLRGVENCETAFKVYECYFQNNQAAI